MAVAVIFPKRNLRALRLWHPGDEARGVSFSFAKTLSLAASFIVISAESTHPGAQPKRPWRTRAILAAIFCRTPTGNALKDALTAAIAAPGEVSVLRRTMADLTGRLPITGASSCSAISSRSTRGSVASAERVSANASPMRMSLLAADEMAVHASPSARNRHAHMAFNVHEK